MAYEYAKLLARIVEICKTQARFAEAMGLSERSVSQKLNGKVGWKQDEIIRACSVLKIALSEIPEYFFVVVVQN